MRKDFIWRDSSGFGHSKHCGCPLIFNYADAGGDPCVDFIKEYYTIEELNSDGIYVKNGRYVCENCIDHIRLDENINGRVYPLDTSSKGER